MIMDVHPTDLEKLITHLVLNLYDKTHSHYEALFWDIACRNKELKQAPFFTFKHQGKTYAYEDGIRFPQTLAASLCDEMNTLVRERAKVCEVEASYARNVIVAACSEASVIAHLYQLLPEVFHEYLHSVQVSRDMPEGVDPLSADTVAAFRKKHSASLSMINQRITRNVIGIIT